MPHRQARLVPAWASVRRADATSFARARAGYDAAAAARADPPAGPRRRSPVSGVASSPPNGHFDARNIQICHQNDDSDHKNGVWPVYTASRSGTSAIPSWALIRSHIAATTSTAMLRSVSSSAVVAYRPCLKRQRQRPATSVKFCDISRSGDRRLVPCARDRRRF